MSAAPATAPPDESEDATTLFDRRQYEALPKYDGHTATKLKISFGGSVEIDINDLDQLERYRHLILGDTIALEVEAEVAKIHWGHETKQANGLKVVSHSVGLKVHSYDIDGEEL